MEPRGQSTTLKESRSKARRGCAHWGQVEPSAQLRLSPLACNPLIVGALPHTESSG